MALTVSPYFIQHPAKIFLTNRMYYTGEGIANKSLRGVHANKRLFIKFLTCKANTLISINPLGIIFQRLRHPGEFLFIFIYSFYFILLLLLLFFLWNRMCTFSYHSVPCRTPCPNGCVTACQTKPCLACLRGCVINAGGGYLTIIDVSIFHSKW